MKLSGRSLGVFVMLMVLMLATRFQHFGSAVTLPDASLAVFLLAGLAVANYRALAGLAFGVLLLEAGGLDYYAIVIRGVSDWCVSPAYWFLIPTYAVMFGAGRWFAAHRQTTVKSGLLFAGVSCLATSAAFLISNSSFYLFSGKFAETSWQQYAERVAQYYPPYLGSALLYLGMAALLHLLVMSLGKAGLAGQSQHG